MGRAKNPTSLMNVAEQQNTVLAKRLSGLITDVSELKDYLGVSPQAINQYRLGVSRPSLENLCKIADFYKVSTDYLLGRTETKTTEEDIAVAVKTTGLSEQAVNSLGAFQKDVAKSMFDIPELNRLLVSAEFWKMVNRLAVYRHECNVVNNRPKIYAAAKEQNDYERMERARADYKFAATDKELALFEAQKFLFKIAGNIENEVNCNAVDSEEGE